MTKTQRKAMVQALEALKHGVTQLNGIGIPLESDPLHAAMTALRAALEEQQGEPVVSDDANIYEFWARDKESPQPVKCEPAEDDPTGYYDPVEGCVMADPMFESDEVKARLVPLYPRAPQPAKQPLSEATHHAFLQGIRYAANKYEAVRDERFSGGDVSNFLQMEAVELSPDDIARAIEAAHGIIGETK